MDALKGPFERTVPSEAGGEPALRAFRATDAFVFTVFQAVRDLPRPEGESLGGEIRRLAARIGGVLVGASADSRGFESERAALLRARAGLLELRYYLYLARRLGLMDLKRYRALAGSQDRALRELDGWIETIFERGGRGPGPPSPDSS